MGLIIVPALYAWYNIAASWDPYGNTKSLKVAVANVDSGYKSDLIPVRVNIGETVVSSLRANHDLDWQFVDRDTAIDGVHSGEYDAALIIPKQFSADMMTLFSPEMKHAELEYYLNEKINPIAPHITDQGASTVATTIDQTFAKTLAQVALDLVSSLLKFAQSPQMSEYVSNATKHISSISSQLKSAASQADSYASLMGATGNIIGLHRPTARLGRIQARADRPRNALKHVHGRRATSLHFCRPERRLLGEHRARPAVRRRASQVAATVSKRVRRDRQGLRHRGSASPRHDRPNKSPPAANRSATSHIAGLDHMRRICGGAALRWTATPRTCRRCKDAHRQRELMQARKHARRRVCRSSPTAAGRRLHAGHRTDTASRGTTPARNP